MEHVFQNPFPVLGRRNAMDMSKGKSTANLDVEVSVDLEKSNSQSRPEGT